jgi:hypothetical protein
MKHAILILAMAVVATLSGCIVYPVGGGHDGGGQRGEFHGGDRR